MGLSGRDLLLAGATGLVGGLLLRQLLSHEDFDGTIFAPVRRGLDVADPRLAPLRPLAVPARIDVPDPKLKVLQHAPDLYRAVRIRLSD